MEEAQLEILFIGEREEDYNLIHYLLSCSSGLEFDLKWEPSYREALKISGNLSEYDILFVDYRPGNEEPTRLVRKISERGIQAPVVVLSESWDGRDGSTYLEAAADDFLPKSQLNTLLLERTILYAIEHRRHKQALQQMEKQLAALQKFVSSAVFITDKNGRITSWSEPVERLTGYSSSEILGAESALIMKSSQAKHLPKHDQKGKTDTCSECVIRTKEGRNIHAVSASFQLTDDMGMPLGILTSLTECSSPESAGNGQPTADQTSEFRQCAEETCRELKQSLKAVQGYTQMVLNYGEYDWRQKKYLESIIQQINRMDSITVRLRRSIADTIIKPQPRLEPLNSSSKL